MTIPINAKTFHYEYTKQRLFNMLPRVQRDYEKRGINYITEYSARRATNVAEAYEYGPYCQSALLAVCDKCLDKSFCYANMVKGEDFEYFAGYMNAFSILGERIINAVSLHEVYHTLTYRDAGEKIFVVSPGLGEMLHQTDIRGMTIEDLQFPYEAFYIHVPDIGFQVWGGETKWHPLVGVYVTVDPQEGGHLEKPKILRAMMIGAAKEKLAAGKNYAMDPTDNALFFFSIELDPAKSLEGQLDYVEKNVSKDEMTVEMSGVWKDIFRWVMNVIIYITSDEVEVEERWNDPEAKKVMERLEKAKGSKKEKLKARFRTMDKRKIVYLGSKISRETAASMGTAIRTRVKGHWRRYHVGEKRASTIKKWIKPFWRGIGDESNPIVVLR